MPTAVFPVPNWTHAGYHHDAAGGVRYFGAPRDGGRRLHAACDLYAPVGSPILAIADGVVKQNPYFFYCDTNALEVVHTGYDGYVFRYGEINRYKVVSHIRAGTKVKAGDVIAYIGRLSGLSISMLHLEMYAPAAAAANVALTVRSGGRFQRSRYLVDPTAHIDSWLNKRPTTLEPQHAAFGHAADAHSHATHPVHHEAHEAPPRHAPQVPSHASHDSSHAATSAEHEVHDTLPPSSGEHVHDAPPAGSLHAPPAARVSPLQLAPVRMYFILKG